MQLLLGSVRSVPPRKILPLASMLLTPASLLNGQGSIGWRRLTALGLNYGLSKKIIFPHTIDLPHRSPTELVDWVAILVASPSTRTGGRITSSPNATPASPINAAIVMGAKELNCPSQLISFLFSFEASTLNQIHSRSQLAPRVRAAHANRFRQNRG